jgi:hypothetical protein
LIFAVQIRKFLEDFRQGCGHAGWVLRYRTGFGSEDFEGGSGWRFDNFPEDLHSDVLADFAEVFACGVVFREQLHHLAAVTEFADAGIEWDFAEEREFEFLGGFLDATASEDIAGHIFDEAEDWDIDLLVHVDGFDGIEKGDLLGGTDDDGAGKSDLLSEGEADVACAGGRSMMR